MTDRDEFAYDVAISLLKEDLPYAKRLEREIRKVVRGEVFLYSRRQEDVAADAALVELFTRVFSDDARIVVVLYRPGWGTTTYTGIEKEAIQSARVKRGSYQFVFMVSMKNGEIPDWFPADGFRGDPELYTTPAIAALIAERVKRTGGRVGRETPAELARRRNQQRRSERLRAERMETEGATRGREEALLLFAELKRHAGEVSAAAAEVGEGLEMLYRDAEERSDPTCELVHGRRGLHLRWQGRDMSVRLTELAGASVRIRHEISSWNYELVLDEDDLWCWRGRRDDTPRGPLVVLGFGAPILEPTRDLAENLIKSLMGD
jgi:hypothetical protein